MLRIAVPNKGSLADAAAEMLREAGYRQRKDTRELDLSDADNDVEFFYLRPRDMAVGRWPLLAAPRRLVCASRRRKRLRAWSRLCWERVSAALGVAVATPLAFSGGRRVGRAAAVARGRPGRALARARGEGALRRPERAGERARRRRRRGCLCWCTIWPPLKAAGCTALRAARRRLDPLLEPRRRPRRRRLVVAAPGRLTTDRPLGLHLPQ